MLDDLMGHQIRAGSRVQGPMHGPDQRHEIDLTAAATSGTIGYRQEAGLRDPSMGLISVIKLA